LQFRGLIAEMAVRPFDHLSVARPRDRAAEAGRDRAGLAENGITDRLGSTPKASVAATATEVDEQERAYQPEARVSRKVWVELGTILSPKRS